jgi:acetyl/propionyl-CoA carboxylase alpha subunit
MPDGPAPGTDIGCRVIKTSGNGTVSVFSEHDAAGLKKMHSETADGIQVKCAQAGCGADHVIRTILSWGTSLFPGVF